VKRITRPNARALIVQTWQSQANLSFFLVLLVVTVFVLPVLQVRQTRFGLIGSIVYSLVLISGVAVGWGRRGLFVTAACATVPALFVRWLAWFSPGGSIQIWSEALSLISVVVIAYVLLAQVFREGPINVMRVQGAVAAYLLLGVAYAYAYQLDSHFNPAAVATTEGTVSTFIDWIYFSFCTLSTLGYGDIVPTSRMSRSLAIGEAISGQLYLAILIARLVAMQVSDGDKARS
jgi:hypothetical protein